MNGFAVFTSLVFAALPATTNYKLNNYTFGSGGTAGSSSATYSIEGSAGQLGGTRGSTANTNSKPGYTETRQANVPKLASIDNNGGQYYNKLHYVIDTQGNPSDAKYLIAVSSDSFATTSYLLLDGTLTTTLSAANYQTYTAWGGASGGLIIGLTPSTNYSVKLKATQGKFTESQYGPVVSGSTAAASLTFGITTSSQSVPPFSVNLGTLNAGTINTGAQTINTAFSTNGTTGGDIYIKSLNSGLFSSSTGNKIVATTTDLSSAGRGFGAQNVSVGQSSGGPFTVVSPYNGSANNIGSIDATLKSLYSATVPVTGATGSLNLKAKSNTTDVAASDYQEVLTFVAAANF